MNFEELKENVKEKKDELVTKVKESKPGKFVTEHKSQIVGVSAGLGALIYGAAKYNQGRTRGYREGISDNALRERDRNVLNATLNYIENAGEDGARFHDRANDRTVTFKKVAEQKDI